MRGVQSSSLLIWIVSLASFVSDVEGAVPCGEPGFQDFVANGNDLRAAASCYVLGTNCESVGGSKAAVQGIYGNDISFWCTGLVTNFNSVFKNMTVSDYTSRETPQLVLIHIAAPLCCRPSTRHFIGILQAGPACQERLRGRHPSIKTFSGSLQR